MLLLRPFGVLITVKKLERQDTVKSLMLLSEPMLERLTPGVEKIFYH